MDKFGVIREDLTPPRRPQDKTIDDLDNSLEKAAAERVQERRTEQKSTRK